ncbi:hypothetical protein B0H14DRAFT_2572622 [Mycena olivaceomarginata]|nr:hypothetical protein B0H14DRAFT_2572622 [Mycena olivaceomarginata]
MQLCLVLLLAFGSLLICRDFGTDAENVPSNISRHYARSLGLKVTAPVLFVSLSVAISASGPSTFLTHEPFAVHVADDLPENILLGSDWLALCRAAASTGDTVFAPGTYETIFNKTPAIFVEAMAIHGVSRVHNCCARVELGTTR